MDRDSLKEYIFEIQDFIDLNLNNGKDIDDLLGLHKIVAIKNSVSIHIYSPPNFYNKKILT